MTETGAQKGLNMKTTRCGLALLATLACAFACGSNTSKPTKTIPLGAVLARTGPYGDGSADDDTDLAVLQMNAALTRVGSDVRFELMHSDSVGTPAIAMPRARDLVAAGAKALVVDVSPDDLEILALQYGTDPAAKLNVPLLGMSVTSPLANNPNACKTGNKPDCTTGVDDNGDNAYTRALRDAEHWNFRMTANTAQQSAIIAKVALTKGQVTHKAAVLYSNDAYGLGSLPGVVAALQANGFTSVESIKVCAAVDTTCTTAVDANDMAQFNTYVSQALDSKTGTTQDAFPDAIVVQTTPIFMVGVIRAYKQMIPAPSIPMVHCSALRTSKILNGLGSDADGSEGVGTVAADGVPGQMFEQAYHSTYGAQLFNYDSNAYDGAVVAMLGSLIAARGLADPTAITGAEIRAALASTSTVPGGQVVGTGTDEFVNAINFITQGTPINYEGASGPVDFDQNNMVVNRLEHFKVVGTTFVNVAVYDCVKDPSCPKQ
jgi:branched-chain amino acid transport system substrate-binding protein